MVGVDRGTRSKIYERIIEQLQTDPVLKSVFGTAWEVGYPQSGFTPPPANASKGIRVELGLGPQGWKSPDKQGGALTLTFYCWFPNLNGNGPNILDCLDVWEAIEAVFYPADRAKRKGFALELQHMGADTGEVLISDPMASYPEDKKGENWVCVARLQLNIKRSLNKG